MQNDGPRLNKLKEVFKKAVQEILKEEEAAKTLLISSQTRDSFYSDSALQLSQDDVKMIFSTIKSRFSETFKEKIRAANLPTLLNNLDRDIKENRVCMNDIRNEEYIAEIFESYTVDKKEEFANFLEINLEKFESMKVQLEEEISNLKKKLAEVNEENKENEQEYQRIVSEMETLTQD